MRVDKRQRRRQQAEGAAIDDDTDGADAHEPRPLRGNGKVPPALAEGEQAIADPGKARGKGKSKKGAAVMPEAAHIQPQMKRAEIDEETKESDHAKTQEFLRRGAVARDEGFHAVSHVGRARGC